MMKAIKVKILGTHINTKPVLVDEVKPDKRYSVGYRKTGNKIAKIAVNTTLIVSYNPEIRIGSFVQVNIFGKFRITDIQKDGPIRMINLEMAFLENYQISFNVDDYVDLLVLGFMASESSSRI